MRIAKKVFSAAAAMLFAGASMAGVYGASGPVAGNQGWDGMLGNDFTVNTSGLQVTQLGAFNSGLDGFTTNVFVGLYDLTAGATVIGPMNFNGVTGTSTFLYQTLASPVALVSGHTYSVEAYGFNGTDMNYNTNVAGVNNVSFAQSTTPITFDSLGGKLTNGDSRYDTASALTGGGSIFSHASTFGAGTLTATAVPEPESYAMMLAGLGALAFMGRRRSR